LNFESWKFLSRTSDFRTRDFYAEAGASEEKGAFFP